LVRKDGQVKLLDFGIAKLLANDTDPGLATQLTLQGGAALTPQFAAPEQINGGAVTTATDVYALGVLLYILLTGQHPAADAHSAAELVKAIVETEPPKSSDAFGLPDSKAAAERRGATADRLRRQLRGDLDTIVGKGLKKNPIERYSSGAAMADDLSRYLKHEPISARPDTITYRAAKFVRRNRIAVALATLVIMAVVGGVIATALQARTARGQRDFALRQLGRAEALNDFNEFILSDASPSGKPFTVRDLLGHAEHILSRQKAVTENRVELLSEVGDQYSLLEDQAKARPILEEAYRLSRGLSDPSVRAAAACALADGLVRSGELERAEALFQQGMKELPDEPQFTLSRVDCLHRGSEVAQERGAAQEAVARMEASLRVLRESPFNSDWARVLILNDLGEAYRMAGQNYKASSIFENVNALLSSMGRDDTRMAGVLYNDWGNALVNLGRPLEGEGLLRRAIEIQGNLPILLNNYAFALRMLARFSEAADYSEKAYKGALETKDRFTIYRALQLRAAIYLDKHDFARSAAMLAELEPLLRQMFPPDHMSFGQLASLKAVLASWQGDPQRALQLANEAVSILEASIKSGGRGRDFLPTILIRRSTIEREVAQPAQAEADATRALEQFQAAVQPGAFSSLIGGAYLNLGKALQAQGETAQARVAFRSAADHFSKTLGPDHPDSRAARQLAGTTAQ
ncbi:MAG: protein kinase, partial [Acidobacteria bacterium Pan2503]|nr:protein kinase [Candidatus Acidoferrum panamensis]